MTELKKVLVEIENLGKTFLSQKKQPLLDSPSIHASLIKGGTELSTYPDYCKIELERRTLPGESRETVAEEIGDLVDKLVERGEIAEQEGKKLVNEIKEKRKKKTDEAEDLAATRMREMMDKMDVPTKSDIDALSAKIATLSKKVDELKKAQS